MKSSANNSAAESGRTGKLSKDEFMSMFNFDENDRDKKDLKQDFKQIESESNHGKVKFKDLIGKNFPTIDCYRPLSTIQ